MTFIMQNNTLSLLPCWLSSKRICLQCRRCEFDPWVRKTPWRRNWQPTRLFFFIFLNKSIYQAVLVFIAVWAFLSLQRVGAVLWLLCTGSHCNRFSCVAQTLGCMGFSSRGCWASSALAQQLWHMGLVASQHVGSSRTRDQTSVPCIGRWILYH